MGELELLGDFEVSGVLWTCINNDHQNAMWYRYLTTEEINSFGYDIDVDDTAPVGEDEIGFFIWNEAFDRPVVVIECIRDADVYGVVASRTNFGSNRPGAAEPIGERFQADVDSISEVNAKVKEFARGLDSV
jgi:hypothetical protein